EWPLGGNLDLHVQRARAAAKKRGTDVEALSWIHMSGFGSCPDRETYPDLIQVFVDSQHDFLEDRVYLAGALVVGPGDQMVEIVEKPPSDETEAQLVVDWATRVLRALGEVAEESSTPVHFYAFDRYDQSVLLDALRRNLDALAEIPDFFDLLTETAALSQS